MVKQAHHPYSHGLMGSIPPLSKRIDRLEQVADQLPGVVDGQDFMRAWLTRPDALALSGAAADALAVAICHLHSARLRMLEEK